MKRLILSSLILFCAVLSAEPTESEIVTFSTNRIPEMQEFYARLAKLAKENPLLKKVKLKPEEVALSGGFARNVTQFIRKNGSSDAATFNEVHRATRDLDLVIMTDIANDADRAAVKDLIQQTMQQTLSDKKAKVRNLDVTTLRDKLGDPLYRVQGYDSTSQALITLTGVKDVAEIAGLNPPTSALDSIRQGKIDYHVEKSLAQPEEFLNQFVQVLRIFKMKAEDPDLELTDTTKANLRKILDTFKERKTELEGYLVNGPRGKYFGNRISDVYGGMLDASGGSMPRWLEPMDKQFGISSFSGVKKAVSGSTTTVATLNPLGNATGKSAVTFVPKGTEVSLGGKFVYSPEKKKIFMKSGRSLTPVEMFETTVSGQSGSRAFSGREAVADAITLPLKGYEVLRVEPYQGNLSIALVRNPNTGYGNLAVIDTSKADPNLYFINGRAFNSVATHGSTLYPNPGSTAPMIGIQSFSVDNGSLYSVGVDKKVSKLDLSGGSFAFSPTTLRAPRGEVVATEILNGKLYTLMSDGKLFESDGQNPAKLLVEHVRGLAKENGTTLVALQQLPSDKNLKFLEIDLAKGGYRERVLNTSGMDADAGIVIGTTAQRMNAPFDLRKPVVTPDSAGDPATELLRLSAKELIERARELRKKFPDGAEFNDAFSKFFKNDMPPQAMTKSDKGPGEINNFMNALRGNADAARLKEEISEAVMLRLLLELRRGQTVDFQHLPNSFVVKELIAALDSTTPGKNLAPVIAALADRDNLLDLLSRNTDAVNRWPGDSIPNWTTFTSTDLLNLAKKTLSSCGIPLGKLANK